MTDSVVGEPQKFFVMVATPTAHLKPGHVHSMERFMLACMDAGIGMTVYRETGDGIVRARNRSVARFLEQKQATHLFFIDDDIEFEAKDAITLLTAGLDICCGVYPKKEIQWNLVAEAVKNGVPVEKLGEHASPLCFNRGGNGQVKVLVNELTGHRFVSIFDAPTGFMCIKREVIEKMIAHHGEEIEFQADYEGAEGLVHHKVFHMDRDPDEKDSSRARYLSEDYWFCRQWQRMGGEIFAFAECNLKHHGSAVFEGCLANLLTTGQKRDVSAAANVELVTPEQASAAE